MTGAEPRHFSLPSGQRISALLMRPPSAIGLLVLGHGAGSNMHVPLMATLSQSLLDKNVATLRFEYPYSDKPDFVPFSDMPMDSDEVLIQTVRAALDLAISETSGLPIFVGGHSISGLISTLADAQAGLPATGIVCLSFPRKGDPMRSDHLDQTGLPILFVQGTEDPLGTFSEINDMVKPLGRRATLRWIDGAAHGFEVADREFDEVVSTIAGHIRAFILSFGRGRLRR